MGSSTRLFYVTFYISGVIAPCAERRAENVFKHVCRVSVIYGAVHAVLTEPREADALHSEKVDFTCAGIPCFPVAHAVTVAPGSNAVDPRVMAGACL